MTAGTDLDAALLAMSNAEKADIAALKAQLALDETKIAGLVSGAAPVPPVVIPPSPSSISGVSMPTTPHPGYKFAFAEDFTVVQPLGTWPGADPNGSYYAKAFAAYDGFTDTSKTGYYDKGIISAHDSVLDYWIHGDGSKLRVACLIPILKRDGAWGDSAFSAARVSYRLRAVADAGKTLQGTKDAWLAWPLSDNWADGETDFPEGGLMSTAMLFDHGTTAATENQNIVAYSTGAKFSDWHTYSYEVLPGQWTKYYLDEVPLPVTKTSQVATATRRVTLQTETDGGQAPSTNISGHHQLDWITIEVPV